MNWRNYSAITTGLLIIAIVFIISFYVSNSSNHESAALDRDRLLLDNAHLKAEIRLRDKKIDSLHIERKASDEKHRHQMDSSAKTRKGMIRKERSLRPDTTHVTLVDTIYTSFESDLAKAKEQRKADSLSHAKEVEILQQSKLDLETAYDDQFADLLKVNNSLILTERKLTRMEKIAKFFGISTATLAVICTVLAVL